MSEKQANELVSVSGSARVFVEGDLVVFEVPHIGRMEFPEDVAEKVAAALLAGARVLKAKGPTKGTTLIL